LIFEIEVLLCERFPGLNPLEINEYRAVDFFKLVRNLNHYNENHENERSGSTAAAGVKKKESYMVKVTD